MYGYGVMRLYGYGVIRLWGYEVIRLWGYEVIRLWVLRLWVMRVSSCLTVRLYLHPYDLITSKPDNLTKPDACIRMT